MLMQPESDCIKGLYRSRTGAAKENFVWETAVISMAQMKTRQ